MNYNYVVRLPIQPVKEVYHIIIFMCTAFWFTFCKVNANRCTRSREYSVSAIVSVVRLTSMLVRCGSESGVICVGSV